MYDDVLLVMLALLVFNRLRSSERENELSPLNDEPNELGVGSVSVVEVSDGVISVLAV